MSSVPLLPSEVTLKCSLNNNYCSQHSTSVRNDILQDIKKRLYKEATDLMSSKTTESEDECCCHDHTQKTQVVTTKKWISNISL